MAHPARHDWIPPLLEALGDNTPVSFDDGGGIWENCKAAWRLHDPKATHHVVIQDDAIVCRDFGVRALTHIRRAEQLHARSLQFYFGNRSGLYKIATKALEKGYVVRSQCNWGVAICLPIELIEPMIAFGDRFDIPQDDTRIKSFLRSRRIRTYYPVPSLVDHRIGDTSLVGDKAKGRCAWYFIDRPDNQPAGPEPH
jgi:hypothetical protein